MPTHTPEEINAELLDAIKAIVARAYLCERCDATGLEPRTKDDACRECGGTGEGADVFEVADLRALIARAEGQP